MPLYEYSCKDCGKHFEKIRSRSEADQPIACRFCQSANTHRALSMFNAHSEGRSVAGTSGGCGGCAGGSCGSCGHQH